MAPAKPKRASGFTRARTGCKTCRRRKLKCDEGKPGCKQCQKSKLDCEYAQGLTFRHQQNAGIENEINTNYLSKFYQRNAATFTPEQRSNFVELPDQGESKPHEDMASTLTLLVVQWAPPVTNPYARGFRREQALFDSAVDNTNELAAHSLNVLADAAQQPSYHGLPSAPHYVENTTTSSHVIDPSLQIQQDNSEDADPAEIRATHHVQHNEGMSKEDASVAQMLKTFSGAKQG